MRNDSLRLLIVAVSSFIAISIVFAAAGGVIPRSLLPQASDSVIAAIPHINVALSVCAIGTILYGWVQITNRRVHRHKLAMIVSVLLFGTFLSLYLYRLIILGGPAPYEGPAIVYQYVYLPVLILHIVLAVICIPLLFEALSIAITYPLEKIPATRHAKIGKIAAALWIVSFAGGILIYLLLYWI